MSIQIIRVLNAILTLVFVCLGKYVLMPYIIINQLLLEILNSKPLYKTHPYKWYNAVFWAYELVLVERIRHFKMNPTAEWWLNSIEHIAFALVIGFLMYILIAIFWLKKHNQWLLKIIFVVIFFNAIGLINEYNQNYLAGRPIFILIHDSQKDLLMNIIGTAIFFVIMVIRNICKQKPKYLY